MSNLYDVRITGIWRYVKGETASFWLICIYLLFEYVRPQTLYPVIDIMPYAQVILILTTLVSFSEGSLFNVKHIGNKLIVLYFCVIILSSIVGISFETSFSMWSDFLAWMLIYFLIINIVNTENRFFVFILSFLLYNFKMAQHSFVGWAKIGFGFSSWGTGGGPGWFENSGEFGIEMCVFFPIAFHFVVALKRYWPKWKTTFFFFFPFTAFTGMISSSSRGALLGGTAVLIWILSKSQYRIKAIIGTGIVVLAVLQFIPQKQMERLSQAGEDKTSQSRIAHWKAGIEIVRQHPMLGMGYKNWLPYYNEHYNGRELPHNIFIECAAELGIIGLSVFFFMVFATFVTNRNTRYIARNRLSNNAFIFHMAHGLDGALIGYLVSGFFVTVLYYPYFWINLAMTVALNNTARKMADDTDDRKCQEENLATNDAQMV